MKLKFLISEFSMQGNNYLNQILKIFKLNSHLLNPSFENEKYV